jgi:peptide/nickel transport system permease protein
MEVDRMSKTQKITKMFKILASLRKNRKVVFGTTAYVLALFISVFVLLNYPPSSKKIGYAEPLLPPSPEHILGTDILGREMIVLLAEAVINSTIIGLTAASIGVLVGSLLGFVGGYYGGRIDYVSRVFTDVFLSVPSLLFLILISSLISSLGKQLNIVEVGLLIALFAWTWPARQVRAQALSLKERDFIYLSEISGERKLEIIIREMMPHMIPWMTASFVNAFMSAILTEAGLSILGLGPQTDMTLGMLLWWPLNNAAMYRGLWWWWIFPLAAFIYMFFSLYIVQIGITEIINPRSKVV